MKRHKKDKKLCTVYGLFDPDTDELRYIGQTRLSLNRRLKYHRLDAERQAKFRDRMTPVCGWIYDLSIEGKKPKIHPLSENATWDISEILLIADAKSKGVKLLNILRGGQDTLDALKRETGFKFAPLHEPIDELEREYREIFR